MPAGTPLAMPSVWKLDSDYSRTGKELQDISPAIGISQRLTALLLELVHNSDRCWSLRQ
jgi:hypothetical protein